MTETSPQNLQNVSFTTKIGELMANISFDVIHLCQTIPQCKLGVLIDRDFKFGVLLLVFARFIGGDTGNLYRNVFLSVLFSPVP
jgi:hypothetical protein